MVPLDVLNCMETAIESGQYSESVLSYEVHINCLLHIISQVVITFLTSARFFCQKMELGGVLTESHLTK